jgi:hypothetical protein
VFQQSEKNKTKQKIIILQPHHIPQNPAAPHSKKRKEGLTESLDGGDNQVASEYLPELRGRSGLAGKSPLQFSDENVAERCRDEETVQRNLYGARADVGAREQM